MLRVILSRLILSMGLVTSIIAGGTSHAEAMDAVEFHDGTLPLEGISLSHRWSFHRQ